MKTRLAVIGAMLAAGLGFPPEMRADLITVNFSAVIESSPFLTSGYSYGDVLSGWYNYDTSAIPLASGFNFTWYPAGGGHLSFGAAEFEAGSGRVDLYHFLASYTPNPVDAFDLYGFSLSGPALEGFSPAFFHLNMTDTDNSVYASLPTPYPIDLPDPGSFEHKTIEIHFLRGTPIEEQSIVARVTGISVPDQGGTIGLISGSIAILQLLIQFHIKHRSTVHPNPE